MATERPKYGESDSTHATRREADGRDIDLPPELTEVLALFGEREPVTTREVTHRLGLRYRAALDRLEQLHEREILDRKEVPDGVVVWWIVRCS